MKRDIANIIRDLDNKNNNDIIHKKHLLEQMFNEDPDLKEILGTPEPKPLNKYKDKSNPTPEELKKRREILDYNEKIRRPQIVPYIKLNGIQQEVLNFIMFDIDDNGENYYNKAIKTQEVIVMAVVHEDNMETEYGIVRTDLLGYIVRDLLCWSNAVGFHLRCTSDRPMIIDNDYYARKMTFTANSPNVVNYHGGLKNRYDVSI